MGMKIALIAGHSRAAPGAVAGAFREQALCRQIVNELTVRLQKCGIEIFDPKTDETNLEYPGYLIERIRRINESGADAAVEMHLNASTSDQVDYSLCLHAPGSVEGARLARCVSAKFSQGYRGGRRALVRPDTWLGKGKAKAFLRKTAMPAVILEPCFLTSMVVREELRLKRKTWAERIAGLCAEGIAVWCGKGGGGG